MGWLSKWQELLESTGEGFIKPLDSINHRVRSYVRGKMLKQEATQCGIVENVVQELENEALHM